ncbi:MAG TPA: FIST N-terminal domain-containing protein, partial [Saprospiraceae bacterium]|nr:FIST N-terminal domain-containing protein [Saprospiraceae bacterium]
MKAKSIKGNTPEEINSELIGSMADGFKPTLAMVFLSVKQDRAAICKILANAAISIFGITTNGEFIDEDLSQESTAILLLDINPAYFTVLLEDLDHHDPRIVTRSMAQKALQKFSNPAILISGSYVQINAEQMLYGFEDILGAQVTLFGGMAGDDFSFTEQFVFTAEKESQKGVIALVLDEDKIMVKGRSACGWKAIGTEKTVTKSDGNRVYTIDDTPALDILIKYTGLKDITKENKDAAMQLATALPLLLQRENGDPVIRAGGLIHWEDHSMTYSGSIPEGAKLRFTLPPDFDVIDQVIESGEKLKAMEMPEVEALILFSCAGRYLSLGPMINKEVEGLKKVWNAPMVGFFSFGEFGRA